jgi:MFS family permease
VGDWAYAIAVAVYAYDQGGPAAVGLLGGVRYVSMALVLPLASTLADRYPRLARAMTNRRGEGGRSGHP